MGYLFLLLAVLAGSTKGYCGKRISGFVSDFGDSALSNCLRMLLCILIGAVAALSEGGIAGLATNPTTLLIALLAGASTAGNVLLWVLAAKNAPYIMLEVFLFLGAIVATVCCSVFFHEPITLFQWVGFALILAATATMSAKKSTAKEKLSLKAFLLLIGSGLTYGMSE
ncbi:MAG: EamA family transporter, partial [Clostridia bacterium]|nr:EamA family transporter [Clostridia bacterium]